MANLSGLSAAAGINPNKSYEVTPSPTDSVSSLSFSPKGNYLVSTSWDNQVRCWEILAGSSQAKASISHDQPVLCSTWKDDGTTVFSAGCDKQAKMWPLLSGGQAVTVAMHDAPIKEIAWIQQMNLLVTGSWDKTLKGVVGDLYLFFHVNEKSGVKREGLNLYSNITIDYTEAILGTVVKVETIKGHKDLHIPAGTQPGATIKVPNMGVPSMKKSGVRGDHHFIVSVEIPKDISDMERSLVEELASLRASSKGHPIPTKGTVQDEGNTTRRKIRNRKKHGKETKPSFWSSIKNLFGKNQSGTGFASVSLQAAPLTTWTPRITSDFSLMVFMCLALVLSCILSCIQRRIDRETVLLVDQQRKSE